MPKELVDEIARHQPPTSIAVSGFRGAVKSGFAAALGHRIVAPVVGIDAFIIDRTMSVYTRWELIDFDRLAQEVLHPFMQGKAVEYGHFNWATNKVGSERKLPRTPRMIVEGVGLFRPSLLKYFSLLVWVDCPLDEAIRRGKKRDREEYNTPHDDTWDGIWRENDVECFNEYRPKEIAHFIISNHDPSSDMNTLP